MLPFSLCSEYKLFPQCATYIRTHLYTHRNVYIRTNIAHILDFSTSSEAILENWKASDFEGFGGNGAVWWAVCGLGERSREFGPTRGRGENSGIV